MNEFQKRALAYNAYRALRKVASKGNLVNLLKYAEDNGTVAPPPAQSTKASKTPGQPTPEGVNMTPTRQKGFSRNFYRSAPKQSRKSTRGCCK